MRIVHQVKRLVSLAMIALVLGLASIAAGQGTQGTLPDPISTKELNGYADRLNLSEQQRMAIESMHDQYKSEFRTLRETDIQKFLDEMRSMNAGGVMPKREVVESFMKKMDVAASKIAAVDSRLFDQIQTVLTPEQQSRLPRVRQARQRARYAAAQIMMMSGQQIVDLSGIVLEMELPPDQFASVDQLMGQYESKLTSNMGKLYDSSTNMMSDLFTELEKNGLADANVNDPETQQKMMEVMQNAWKSIMQKSMDIANETADLNKRTCRNVLAVLPEDSGRTFREAFYRRAYPEVHFAFGNATPALQEALKSTELTDEQRQGLSAALTEYHSKLDRIVEDTVAMLDETRGAFTPWEFNSESMENRNKALAEASKTAQELHLKALAALDSIDPELKRKFMLAGQVAMQKMFVNGSHVVVQSMDDDIEEELEEDEAEAEDVDAEMQAEVAQGMLQSGDRFVPGPIDHRQIADMTAHLKLNAEQKSVLDELHRAYQDKYKAIQENEIAACIKAQHSMWRYDEATQTTSGPTISDIDQCYDLRKTAMRAVQTLDGSFFDDIELAVLTAAQQPLMASYRASRERAWYAGTSDGWWFGMGSSESSIDLTALVRQLQIQPDVLAKLEPVLTEYSQRSTPAVVERFHASFEMQRMQEHWQAIVSEAQKSEGNLTTVAFRYREVLGPSFKRSSEANAAMTKLNAEFLPQIEAALPPDSAFAFRNAYNKQAYPNVYNDGGCVIAHLQRAAALTDLSEDQRQRILDLQAEYQPAYEDLSRQMAEASNGLDSVNFFDEDNADAMDWQVKQEKISRLQFDRNELNARAGSKLKNILQAEQLKSIGGLPETDQG